MSKVDLSNMDEASLKALKKKVEANIAGEKGQKSGFNDVVVSDDHERVRGISKKTVVFVHKKNLLLFQKYNRSGR